MRIEVSQEFETRNRQAAHRQMLDKVPAGEFGLK
jgi:hypothetical protein